MGGDSDRTAKHIAPTVLADVAPDSLKLAIDEINASGGLGYGLPLAHLTVCDLPFGGVDAGGMGNYHGRYSIETFSHRKAARSARGVDWSTPLTGTDQCD